MDILALVTLIALALAMSMVVITARLLREERRRSEARVAALTAAAASEPEVVRTVAPAPPWPPRRTSARAEATIVRPRAEATMVRSRADEPAAVADLHLYPAPEAGGSTPLTGAIFGAVEEPEHSGSMRLFPVAAIGVLVVGLGVGAVLWSDSRESLTVEQHAVAAAPVSAAASPLELVALRHRREGDRLAISGIIKNPSGGRAVRNVSAVVFLFDQSGSFLSSGRAPLDFTTLGPGEESPFVITVSEPGAVARYRVSFRSDDHVMPHVDRREPAATAAPAVSRTRGGAAGGGAEHLVE